MYGSGQPYSYGCLSDLAVSIIMLRDVVIETGKNILGGGIKWHPCTHVHTPASCLLACEGNIDSLVMDGNKVRTKEARNSGENGAKEGEALSRSAWSATGD